LQAILIAIMWTLTQPTRVSEHHLIFRLYVAESHVCYFRRGELPLWLYLCMSALLRELELR